MIFCQNFLGYHNSAIFGSREISYTNNPPPPNRLKKIDVSEVTFFLNRFLTLFRRRPLCNLFVFYVSIKYFTRTKTGLVIHIIVPEKSFFLNKS